MSEFDERNRPDEPAGNPEPADGTPMDIEMLSAYLEDPADLDADLRHQVEQSLAADPVVRRRFDELDALTSALGDLPEPSAPRSYRLTPEMIGEPTPANVVQPDVWYVRHMEKMRWAAAAVALLFVLTVSADLVVNGLGPSGMDDMDDESAVQRDAITDVPEEDSARSAEDSDTDAAQEESMEAADEPAAAADDGEAAVQEEEEADSADEGEAAVEEEEAEVAEDEASDGDDAAGATEEPDASILTVDPTSTESPVDDAAPEAGFGADPTGTPTPDENVTAMQAQEESAARNDGDGDSDRAAWRAVQFGLIVVFAVLLGMILILPRRR